MAVKIYDDRVGVQLSTNFNSSEFNCKGNGCCKETYIDDQLIAYLQKIHDHFGKPVIVTSGYRCPTHNKRVSGSTSSYHTKGQAADIVISGVAPAEVAKYAESLGILGIGLYETAKDGHFVHVDTRTKKYFWYGQGEAKRTTFGGAVEAPTKPSVEASTYDLKQFVKDVQKACGAAVDGIAGPETLSKTVTVSSTKNTKHAVVRAIQKRLLALGYSDVGEADGIAGPKFDKAVKQFQAANSCEVDGEITKRNKTWKKLLGMS